MTSSRHIRILGSILVVLLTALNVQLLVDRRAAAPEDRGTAAPVPALPEGGDGPSSDALLRELDAVTRSLARPLRGLRKDLRAATAAAGGPIDRLGPELAALGRGSAGIQASLRGLDGTGRELLQVAALAKSLPDAFAELRRFRTTTVPTIVRELQALRRETGVLTKGIPALSEELSGTRSTLSDVTTTLRETNAALDRAARCLRRPIVCE